MKSASGRLLALFFMLLGPLCASDWTHWQGMGGAVQAERSAHVVGRSKRDEAGDDKEKGYLFVYELHNLSSTLAARVFLSFPVQDPTTGRWEIDRNTPTIVHDVPPSGTVTGTRYSPSERGLAYESDVKWPEELTGERERKAEAGEKPAGAASEPGAGHTGPQAEFEGLPLSDKAALKAAVDKYMEPQTRFRATILFHIPPGETSWTELVDDESVDRLGTWRQYFDYYFSFLQQKGMLGDRSYGCDLRIVSATMSEMVVKFEDVTVDDVRIFLNPDPAFTWHETNPIVMELVRLEPAAASASAPRQ